MDRQSRGHGIIAWFPPSSPRTWLGSGRDPHRHDYVGRRFRQNCRFNLLVKVRVRVSVKVRG